MSHGLNLGSGPHYAQGWTNVDLHAPEQGKPPDAYADVFDLDMLFEPDKFERAYLGHFLEHLEYQRIPDALAQVTRVVKPGGVVMAVGPCILRAVRTRQPESLLLAILADPSVPNDGRGHAWTPTTDLTMKAMAAGGLTSVTEVPIRSVVPPEWPNTETSAWQCAVSGVVA